MKLTDLSKSRAKRVMGIDASTQSIAFSVWFNRRPVQWGKLPLRGADSYAKIGDAAKKTFVLLDLFEVDYIAIEQAVFVNNMGVVKKLAYVFGAVLGQAGLRDIPIMDVSPLSWQPYIGNPTWTKAEKAALRKQHPGKSKSWYSNEMRKQRKRKTIDILNKQYGIDVTDDDVADAIGVGAYAYKELTRRK